MGCTTLAGSLRVASLWRQRDDDERIVLSYFQKGVVAFDVASSLRATRANLFRSLCKLSPPRIVLWWVLLVSGHAAILFAPLFMPWLYGGAAVLHDVWLYFDYASRVASGMIPYRDYVVEYPPLALLLMLLPRMLTSDFGWYAMLFAVLMLLFDVLTLYLVARWVSVHDDPSSVPILLGWCTLFFAVLYPMLAARYDLAPTAMAFAATTWWFSGRPASGAVAAACGTLLKIYPIFVAALAFVHESAQAQTTRLRGSVIFVATMLAAVGAWWALGGAVALRYHLGRGLQIETVWAGILMGIGNITGTRMEWDFNHSSVELLAPGAHAAAALAVPAQGAALLLVIWRFWRSGLRDPLQHVAAAVLAFVVGGKVLSPQYLIWLTPFIVVLRGRTGRTARFVFLLSCVATTLVYPWGVWHLLAFEPGAVALLNFRNGLLLTLFGLLLFRLDAPVKRTIRAGDGATLRLPSSGSGVSGDSMVEYWHNGLFPSDPSVAPSRRSELGPGAQRGVSLAASGISFVQRVLTA
jgi:hypothetical protein